MEAWATGHRDWIELLFLPRYAPERNADEYLNNNMKGRSTRLACRGVKRGLAQD